jgi:hypothetical protein
MQAPRLGKSMQSLQRRYFSFGPRIGVALDVEARPGLGLVDNFLSLRVTVSVKGWNLLLLAIR